jgi:glycosyltransferase involved in cell wall biosynthesis
MRILVVSQYYYPENTPITSIAEELVKRGHHVEVLTGLPNYGYGEIVPGYQNKREEVINGVEIHRVKLSPRKAGRLSIVKNYLSFWRNSKKFVRHFHKPFDLVYSMTLSPVISIAAANIFAKKNHIPHVIHCLDLWPESPVATGAIRKHSLTYLFLYHWSRKLYKGGDRILISSPSFERYFVDVLHFDSKKIYYVPQGALVGTPEGDPIVYSHKFNIVYAGNIGSLQLIEEFTEACKYLKGRYDFSLQIIGNGSRADRVKDIISKNHLEDIVTFHGEMLNKEAVRYYPNATGLVVSLLDEGNAVSKVIPNKLITSLYFGRPIVASIGGDGRKVLKEAKGAVFAEPNSFAVAQAYEELFSKTEEERQKLGQNNKNYYNQHFEISKVMDELEAQFNVAMKA